MHRDVVTRGSGGGDRSPAADEGIGDEEVHDWQERVDEPPLLVREERVRPERCHERDPERR
jgi:hypothetical protein